MRVAAIQLCSTTDILENNSAIETKVRQAAKEGAQLVSLPEAANVLHPDQYQYLELCSAEAEDTTLALCKDLASELGIWVHTGSLLFLSKKGDKIHNRAHILAPNGQAVAVYDKIHRFDVALGGAGDFLESNVVAASTTGPVVANLGEVCLGMSICYDLRFPKLFQSLAQAGANVLLIPASFSTITGPLHWEALLTARAIETGCFVIAAAQCGERDGMATHGHSMIISPMGEVLAQLQDAPGTILSDVDPDLVTQTRKRLPCLQQGMPDYTV
ncbi:carbon-nitrogen hydrolase family protein [uncultured Shimia sp.]|uniref:carbon-nitrogen hydrolase family protein n=1 Tax=uncultured Shimia sp. TaxID=573152 RepID=UPI002637147B|nr:carbon-nitrogen hydrolase family protein [uncultured Shimia sp.]